MIAGRGARVRAGIVVFYIMNNSVSVHARQAGIRLPGKGNNPEATRCGEG